jgi:hypothetical protein
MRTAPHRSNRCEAARTDQVRSAAVLSGRGRYHNTIELTERQLVTPAKHRLGQRPPTEVAKARIRLVIESVFSNLKGRMRLEHHLAKTIGGLAQ